MSPTDFLAYSLGYSLDGAGRSVDPSLTMHSAGSRVGNDRYPSQTRAPPTSLNDNESDILTLMRTLENQIVQRVREGVPESVRSALYSSSFYGHITAMMRRGGRGKAPQDGGRRAVDSLSISIGTAADLDPTGSPATGRDRVRLGVPAVDGPYYLTDLIYNNLLHQPPYADDIRGQATSLPPNDRPFRHEDIDAQFPPAALPTTQPSTSAAEGILEGTQGSGSGDKKKDWDQHKPRLQKLYIDEKRSIKELIQIMQQEHGFVATEKQYRYQLGTKWGWRKYNKRDTFK